MDNVKPYPLCWPPSRPRARRRRADNFRGLTPAKARTDLREELRRLGATHVVVSSDCGLRRDGEFSVTSLPDDPGVSVYFLRKGVSYVMACDTYVSFAANLRALSKTIEALRAIERHGDATMMEQAFRGFKELPAASQPRKTWRETLGLNPGANLSEAKSAYRKKIALRHSDKTDDHDGAAELGRALLEARTEFGDVSTGEDYG